MIQLTDLELSKEFYHYVSAYNYPSAASSTDFSTPQTYAAVVTSEAVMELLVSPLLFF